ncbi:MAG: hypothetical protein H6828_09030 [Planctomycetes bacterium]|nr:hypothetical protein [Planctomycetota bacterium]
MDAKKVRYGEGDLDEVLDGITKVVATRGKKELVFDLKQGAHDHALLVKHVLGPSGNLRAPTLRLGKTLVVGFGDDTYAGIFG